MDIVEKLPYDLQKKVIDYYEKTEKENKNIVKNIVDTIFSKYEKFETIRTDKFDMFYDFFTKDNGYFEEMMDECEDLVYDMTNEQVDELYELYTELESPDNLCQCCDFENITMIAQDIIKDEFEVIKNLHTTFSNPNQQNVRVEGNAIGCSKAKTEKAIYRLNQLGIVEDWTISNFFGISTSSANFLDKTFDTS